MRSLLRAGVGGLVLSGAAYSAVVPRQDDTSLSAVVAKAAADASIGPATLNPSQQVDLVLAVGDSYTAGIGSNGKPDYIDSSSSCSRYKSSWPSQLINNGGWGDFNGGFTPALAFGACSGAKTTDLIDKQLAQGDPFLHQTEYIPIGKPQIAVMTIGGNDVGFGDAVNDCIYRAWRPNDCDQTLSNMEAYIAGNEFNANIVRAISNIIASGRQAGGATPTDSFQVYIAEYIGFWNHDDQGCDDVSWCMWYSEKIKLTTYIRHRMNKIVDQLNDKIHSIADEMAYLGVVWVGGVQPAFDTHRFCEPAPTDYLNDPVGSNTWFWSWGSGGWDSGSEGPDGQAAAQDFVDLPNKLLDAVITDPAARASVSESNPPWAVNSAFNSEQELHNALTASGNDDVRIQLSELTRRMFHPKGRGYTPYANAFMNAIRSHRGSVNQQTAPPPPPPPPAFTPGQCGFHLREEWKAYPMREDGESHITVKLVDGAQKEIGHLDQTVIHGGVGVDVTSALPWTVTIVPGDTGEDWQYWNYYDFQFAYAGTSWHSDATDGPAHCKVGGRDLPDILGDWMTVDMDCVFPC